MKLRIVAMSLALPLLMAVAGAQVPAGPAQAPEKAVLVELFTSEGCSSCPPADALLAKLNGKHVENGQTIIALSEHVTYWNQLGWADPFSQALWTARQNLYGEHFHLDSVYTPQVVVNGERQLVGSDGAGLLKAINSTVAGPASLTIDEAKVSAGKLNVRYRLAMQPEATAEVWAVIADDMASSEVLRGENSGRKLMHVAVARTLTKLEPVTEAAGHSTALLEWPPELKGQAKTGRHLVLFVQEKGAGRMLAVVSRRL